MSISVKELKKQIKSGKFSKEKFERLSDSNKVDLAVDAGWYDWFCSDKSLGGRTVKVLSIVNSLESETLDNNYSVWFKNNCPASNHPLYDDIRFEPLNESEREDKYFVITVDDKRVNAKYEISAPFKKINLYAGNKKELRSQVYKMIDLLK